MMNNKLIVGSFCIILCSGCSQIKNTFNFGGTKQKKITNKECANNKFLQKYNCSTSTVEQLATNGDAKAAYTLGYMYYYGLGVPQNQESAQLWIARAANLGNNEANSAQDILVTYNDKHNPRHTPPSKTKPRPIPKPQYSIQLGASKNIATLQKMIHKYHLTNVSITKKKDKGTEWYVLLQGDYQDKNQAYNELNHLPQQVKALKPWVRSIG